MLFLSSSTSLFFFQLVKVGAAVHGEGKLMLESKEAFAQP